MVAPGIHISGGPGDNCSPYSIHGSFASYTMAFNAQAQRKGDEISGLRAAIMEMGVSNQQQLQQMAVNMAPMVRHSGGHTGVPTTISAMTQIASAPALVYVAAGFVVPPVHVPSTLSATIDTACCDRRRHAGS